MNDLSIVIRQMCVFVERRFAEDNLGFPELITIMYLADSGPSKQEDIARYFEIDKGATSKTIAKLESKGYVSRQVNPRSRREKLVSLEPQAENVFSRMRSGLKEWEDVVLDGIDEKDHEVATRVLAQMAANSNRMLHEGRQ